MAPDTKLAGPKKQPPFRNLFLLPSFHRNCESVYSKSLSDKKLVKYSSYLSGIKIGICLVGKWSNLSAKNKRCHRVYERSS